MPQLYKRFFYLDHRYTIYSKKKSILSIRLSTYNCFMVSSNISYPQSTQYFTTDARVVLIVMVSRMSDMACSKHWDKTVVTLITTL